MSPELFHKGPERDIFLCSDAKDILADLKVRAEKDKALRRMLTKILYLFDRFAATGSLSNDEHFKHEGDGFWAFKAYQLRAYGWYSASVKGAFIVSHFAIKKKNQLSASDKERMTQNRKRNEPKR